MAVAAESAHGINGLPPDGAVGFIRETSRMMFSVRCGVILKFSNASLMSGSSFLKRCLAR